MPKTGTRKIPRLSLAWNRAGFKGKFQCASLVDSSGFQGIGISSVLLNDPDVLQTGGGETPSAFRWGTNGMYGPTQHEINHTLDRPLHIL